MKKRNRLIISLIALSIGIAGCGSNTDAIKTTADTTAKTTAEQTSEKPTAAPADTKYVEPDTKEKDSYVLYALTYTDAKGLGSSSSESIQITSQGDEKVYTFKNHLLSCGTHMTGTIIEQMGKDNISIKGDFNVTDNPFNIQKLKFDITQANTDIQKLSGNFIIDDAEPIDVNNIIIPIDPAW